MSTRTRILAGVAIAAAAAMGGALWQAAPLAEWALPRLAAWYGIAPLRLQVADIGWSGVVLDDVSLGDPAAPDIAARRIAVEAPWADLRRGRADSVAIDGLRVRARWVDGHLSLGVLDPLLAAEGGDMQAGRGLPFGSLNVQDGEATVATPWGPLQALFDARLATVGGREGTVDMVVRHDAGWLRGSAVLSQGLHDDVTISVDVQEAEAAVTGLAIRLGGGGLRATFPSSAAPTGTVDVAIDRLAVAGRSFAGLSLEGALDGTALRVALSGGAVAPGLALSAQGAVSDVTADDGAVSVEARLQLGDLARDPAGGALPYDALVGGSIGLHLETTVGALVTAMGGQGATISPRADLDLTLRADATPFGPLRSTVAGRLTADYTGNRLRLGTAADFALSVTGVPPGLEEAVTLALSAPPGTAEPLAVDIDLAHGVADVIADTAFSLSAADQAALAGVLSGNAVMALQPFGVRHWHVVDLAFDGGPLDLADHRLTVTAARLSGKGSAVGLEAGGHLEARYDGAPVPGLSVAAASVAFDGDVAWRDGGLSLAPRGCLALSATALRWSPAGLETGPLALCLEAPEAPLLTWRPAAEPGSRLAVAANARLTAPLSLRARVAGGEGVDSLRFSKLSLTARDTESDVTGRVEVAADRIAVRRPPFLVSGGAIAGAGTYGFSGDALSFTPDGCMAVGAKGLSAPAFALTEPIDLCLKARTPPTLTAAIGGIRSLRLAASVAPASIAARLGDGDAATPVTGTLPGLDLQADWNGAGAMWSVDTGLSGGDLVAGDRWRVAEVKARFSATGMASLEDGELHLDSLTLADRAPAPMLAPLTISGAAFVVERSARFDLKVGDAGGLLDLTAQGRHDLATGAGEATFGMPTLTFATGRQPQQLLPVLRGIVTSVRGSLDVSGDAAWGESGLSSSMAVSLAGGSLGTKVAELSGVAASARFDSIWPPSTPPGQTLSIASADVGVPLEDIQVSFRVLPQGAVLVERAAWPWMGGTVEAADVTLDPADSRHAMVLEVSDVEVTRVLDIVDFDDLSGSGRLSGRIPVEVVDGTPYIRSGRLASEEGGVLSYISEGVDAALRSGGQGGALLADALRDFRYKSLVMELDGQTTGDITARVLLAGSNPDLYDGYPIELNTTFEGNLGQIMRGARATYGISDSIREQLENAP